MSPEVTVLDDRVLLLGPTRKDAAVTTALLENAGLRVTSCMTFDEMLDELDAGASVIIVPEEMCTPARNTEMARRLLAQPPWSDLPVLVLAGAGADSPAARGAVRTLGNVTLLERPLRVATLLTAVRTAVRARQRQYQIREHLAERARAEEALRSGDRRKDEFLATLGHELRNPLAPLLSGLHLLRLADTGEAKTRPVLTVMERQVRHLVRLVDDLLGVSRMTRGLIDVRHDPLDLVTVVRAALETARPTIDAADHQVTTDWPETPVPVAGDAVRLTQVFANLLTNAAKYTNPGGQIRVAVMQADGRAIVSIRDNGIGIPASHLSSVFEMFMQVDRASRHAQGGLGIGLTLVRSLVEMHGGHVEARSEGPGTGSEFLVQLPVLEEPVRDNGRPSTLPRFVGRRILVVDDNCDAADTLGALLTALGATVSVAHSGLAALECLDRSSPDAVLLDLGMPDMDGYEVARRVRATPAHDGTLLIALTGWGQDQDMRQSAAVGFDHHLVKPPDLDRLQELLATR